MIDLEGKIGRVEFHVGGRGRIADGVKQARRRRPGGRHPWSIGAFMEGFWQVASCVLLDETVPGWHREAGIKWHNRRRAAPSELQRRLQVERGPNPAVALVKIFRVHPADGYMGTMLTYEASPEAIKRMWGGGYYRLEQWAGGLKSERKVLIEGVPRVPPDFGKRRPK